MSTVYLGIDQSVSGFGVVAYFPELGEHEALLGQFPPGKYGTGIDRLMVVEGWFMGVLEVFERENVRHICMEGYNRGARNWREEAGELGHLVKRSLRKTFLDLVGYPTICPPNNVKQFATGKGRAEKSLMLKAVYQKWGADFDNDNLADAYTMARMAEALGGDREDLLVYEKEALGKLTPYTEQPHPTPRKTRRRVA